MQRFVDPQSPRFRLSFEQLPRGVVKFPPPIVEAVAKQRAKYSPEIYTEEYARRSLQEQTLHWYYAGLPVAYRPLPDGLEAVGVGWEETAKYWASNCDPEIKVVQP